jgi:hypothetical protein
LGGLGRDGSGGNEGGSFSVGSGGSFGGNIVPVDCVFRSEIDTEDPRAGNCSVDCASIDGNADCEGGMRIGGGGRF